MRKSINIIISLLSLLCIIGAVKLSSLPLLPMFSVNSFWYTPHTVRESFSLLYDIFVGFLLSAIFYFLVEVLPEKLRLYRGRKLIYNYVNILLKNMEQIISITKQVFQVEADKPYLIDVVHLSGDTTHAHEEVSYETSISYKTGKRKSGIKQGGEFDSTIKSCISTIETQLQNIRHYGTFFASDERFVEVITRIESCEFISYYRKEHTPHISCFLFANSVESFLDFCHLYAKLLKCNIHTEITKTIIDTPEQAVRYKERRDSGEMLNNVALYQLKRNRAYENEKPIILCQDINKEKNIVMLIQKCVPKSCVYNLNELQPGYLNSSQLLIVLGENIDLNFLGNEIPPKIFCFFPRTIFLKPINSSKRTGNVEKVFYQKRLSFLGFSIFAGHPMPAEIKKLTSAVDKYIIDKYKLELLM